MSFYQRLTFGQTLVRCDLFEKACDHTYWSNLHPYTNNHFQAGDVVFCKTDEVLRLFEHLRLTRKRIVLVTGESDIPCDFFRQQFLPLNVERWFAANVTHPHPKVTALPLGLGAERDLVTLNLTETTWCQNKNAPRDQWLYINFRPETNPKVRQKIYDTFKLRAQQEKWMTFESPRGHGNNEEFLTQLRRHRFVLAPPGNGIDTHRLWEALALGAYPVALRSALLESFEALPILFVNHYEEVTLDFLKASLEQLEEKRKNYSLLQMSYWEKKIHEAQSDFSNQKMLSWSKWLQESFCYGVGMIQRKIHEHRTKH